MPTYTYRRADGTTFDIEQRITESAIEACPTTGQDVRRIITTGAGLVFKGTGFYQTDYVRNGGSDGAPKTNGKSSAPAEAKGDDSKEKKTPDTKPADAS